MDKQEYKKGQYYAVKHDGRDNGDLLIGQVKSARNNNGGDIILINLLTGTRAVKAAKILRQRNKRIRKNQADLLVDRWRKTKDKQAVRRLALTLEEFKGNKRRKSVKPKRTPVRAENTAPVDYERCQAEKTEDASFMLLGKPVMVRCSKLPAFVAKEKKPGKDGSIGQMSLCDDCAEVFKVRMPLDYADLIPIIRRPPKASKPSDLVMLDAILSGMPLWEIKGLPDTQRKAMTTARNRIHKEHEYLLKHEPADEFHACVLLGALNLINGLLEDESISQGTCAHIARTAP